MGPGPRFFWLCSPLMSPDLEQAAIGFGGALIGAVVGGAFVVMASRGQWKHDRLETSRIAAGRLLGALFQVEAVFATLLQGGPVAADDAAQRFNSFSQSANAELPFVLDREVGSRVLAHVNLCWTVLRVAPNLTMPAELTAAVRRHADAVTDALQAHIQGARLPDYTPLPMDDLRAIIAWPHVPH